MSTPGTTPTSAKIAASLMSSRLPNLPRRRRWMSRNATQPSTSTSSTATTTLMPNRRA